MSASFSLTVPDNVAIIRNIISQSSRLWAGLARLAVRQLVLVPRERAKAARRDLVLVPVQAHQELAVRTAQSARVLVALRAASASEYRVPGEPD
ncbi:MAG TPA: hypothetical protein VHA37_05065 [Candidatus Saccharimonadales bacterium]|nr:hypothetical protein [Candidatus Saccharimonadales bacterium]